MNAENSLGMSPQYLHQHEYCMAGQLTYQENEMLISRITEIVQSRPEDVHFESMGIGLGAASIDGIRLHFGSVAMQMAGPAPLWPWHYTEYPRAHHLYQILHDIRHRHHNSATVETIAAAVGGFITEAPPPQPVAPVEPEPEPIPIAATTADDEVSKMKTIVDQVLYHPAELVGAVFILGFAALAAHML